MIGRYSALHIGLIVYFVVVMGAAMGMSVGYDASTVEGTQISYNGSAVHVGDNVTQLETGINATETDTRPDSLQWINDRIPEIPGNDVLQPYIRPMVIEFTEALVHASLTVGFFVADVTATVAFYMSPIVPQWLVSGVLNIAAVAPFGILGLSLVDRL